MKDVWGSHDAVIDLNSTKLPVTSYFKCDRKGIQEFKRTMDEVAVF